LHFCTQARALAIASGRHHNEMKPPKKPATAMSQKIARPAMKRRNSCRSAGSISRAPRLADHQVRTANSVQTMSTAKKARVKNARMTNS